MAGDDHRAPIGPSVVGTDWVVCAPAAIQIEDLNSTGFVHSARERRAGRPHPQCAECGRSGSCAMRTAGAPSGVRRVAVTRMSGSDPRKIRTTLEAAEGYAVFDAEGKRLGAFVELAADDRIAIRHDGVFVWHRRLLPITDVVNVIPDQRAVVLKVSKRTLADTKSPASQAPNPPVAEEIRRQARLGKNELNVTLGRSRETPISRTSVVTPQRPSHTTKTCDTPLHARRMRHPRRRPERIRTLTSGTCSSSRHQPATPSPNKKGPLHAAATASRYLGKRLRSSS